MLWRFLDAERAGGRFKNREGGSVEQHIDRRLQLHHCLNYAALLSVLDDAHAGLNLFEVGCGSGALSRALAHAMPEGWRLTATDYDPVLVEHAARLNDHPHLAFRRLDLLTLDPRELEPFGAACLLEVIEHLSLEQASEMLRRFHAGLRPGSRVILTTIDRSAHRRRFSGYPPHVFEYDRRAMTRLLGDPAWNPFPRWRLLRLTSPRIAGEQVRSEDRGGYVINRLSGLGQYLARRFSLFGLALDLVLTVGYRLLKVTSGMGQDRFDLEQYLDATGLREDPAGELDSTAFGLVVELVRE